MESIKQIKALCFVRLRLLWNTLKSKSGISKIIGMGFAAILMIIATASGAYDILEAIYKLPFSNLISEWAVGLLVIYGIFVVFTGDLVSGHTLNTGQMSSDFHYLSTLPIPTTILIFIKIFERLITDYFGILFLLPALIGIACYKAYTPKAFLIAILIYLEISITIGLFINLTLICLTRFFKTSTINNFFSIFGYISAILTLIPFLALSNFNPNYIPTILEKMAFLQDNFEWLILPLKWLAVPLLYSTPFCNEFGKLTILWLLIISFLTLLFHQAVKNKWFNYVHSSKTLSYSIKNKRFFKGLFWKELIMLKSDFNLLINAILMPISIIIVEIYFLKQVFSFTSIHTVMNFIYGSIIYFSLFGPINIIGYEGKAISLLEILPISPGQLLKKKYYFWLIIALIIFVPSTIITLKFLSFDFYTILIQTILTILFSAASIWVTVSISAIFAKYDTAILQQHSSFIGKMAAMAVMSILLPLKEISWFNFYSISLFLVISILCYIKAKACLIFRQDQESLYSEDNLMIDSLFLLFSFTYIENGINQFFYSIIPDTDTGIWSWVLSLFFMLPFLIIYRKKSSTIIPKTNLINFSKAILIAFISVIVSISYLKYNSNTLNLIISDINQIKDFCNYIYIPKYFWQVLMLLLSSLFMTSVVRRVDEYLLTNNNFFIKVLGLSMILLLSLHHLIPFTVFFLLTLLLFNYKNYNSSITIYSSLLFFTSIFYYLIF